MEEQPCRKLIPSISTKGTVFASVHASVFNHFNRDRSLSKHVHFKRNRTAALTEWCGPGAAQEAASLSYPGRVRIRLTTPSSLFKFVRRC